MKKTLLILSMGCLLPLWAQPQPPMAMEEDRMERPMPPEMGPPGMPPHPPDPRAAEQIQIFLQQNCPERARQLEELKRSNAQEYWRNLLELGHRVRPLIHLQQEDPAAFPAALGEFQLDDKVHSLAQAYRKAAASDRTALKEQMKPLLEQLFSARQQHERQRLEKLKAEVGRLEARVQQREVNKTAVIQHHLEELTSDDSLRW